MKETVQWTVEAGSEGIFIIIIIYYYFNILKTCSTQEYQDFLLIAYLISYVLSDSQTYNTCRFFTALLCTSTTLGKLTINSIIMLYAGVHITFFSELLR